MKRIRAIILLMGLLLAILAILTISGVQYVTTNKDVYESGEMVNISYWDVGLLDQTCKNMGANIYKKTKSGWEEIKFTLSHYRKKCVNGTLRAGFYGCDINTIKIKPYMDSGNTVWRQKIFKDVGYTKNCSGRILNERVKNYSIQEAPKGIYKVQYGHFGLTEKIFEIK